MLGHRTTPRGNLFLLLITASAVAVVALAAALTVATPARAAEPLPAPTPPPGTVPASTVPGAEGTQPAPGARTTGAGGKADARKAAQPAARTAPAATAPATTSLPAGTLFFPVLGPNRYTDDFGDARAQGGHEGNDIIAPRWAPVVAVEDGRVKWWTRSSRAGCMLYLYGKSGATYLYIHLNNDRTADNDNRGGCVDDITYTVKDGAKVLAGEQIAWSGDSGDADGNPHLHFELHPGGGEAVSPFTMLNGSVHTLFPARRGDRAAVGIRGLVVAATATTVDVRVSSVRWWPGGRWSLAEPRVVRLAIDAKTEVDPDVQGTLETLGSGATIPETEVTIVSRAARTSPEGLAALPGALVAQRVRAVK